MEEVGYAKAQNVSRYEEKESQTLTAAKSTRQSCLQ